MTIHLNYRNAHDFVNKHKREGFYWDGFTIVKWFPSHKGYTSVHGLFKNNKWGIAHRYNMKSNGTWSIPEKYVKNT